MNIQNKLSEPQLRAQLSAAEAELEVAKTALDQALAAIPGLQEALVVAQNNQRRACVYLGDHLNPKK